MTKRLIFIGDVHGCIDELNDLLEKLEWTPSQDRLILLGDLVDRGPDSKACVRFAMDSDVECVAGNHDNKFARYWGHEKKRLASVARRDKKIYKNPMRMREDKRKDYESLDDEEREFLCTLPNSIYVEEHKILVVHAGVRPGRWPFDQPGNIYRHCRYIYEDDLKLATLDTTTYAQPEGSKLWPELYTYDTHVVYGHHVESMTDPAIRVNQIGGVTVGLDTGCCFGGRLTALVIEEGEENRFVQVDARKVYMDRSKPNS